MSAAGRGGFGGNGRLNSPMGSEDRMTETGVMQNQWLRGRSAEVEATLAHQRGMLGSELFGNGLESTRGW